MSTRDDIQEKRSPEDKFISSNIETTSTSDALQLEPSVARKVEQVCASPATSNVTHKKDLNASQSMLSGLVDLPIEIFAEIASLAQPGDLLSLARCCKPLREMLMRPWVAYIWRSAENNVEELPHCPEDMCEPQYAALLFTNFCTSCGEKTSSQADPNLRVRLCSECCATKLVVLEDSWERGQFSPGLLPVTTGTKFGLKNAPRRMYGAESNIEYCLIEDMEEVVSEHIALMNTHNENLYLTWRMNRCSYVEKRRQFGHFLARFLCSFERPRLLELRYLRMERQKIIYERLRGLGWSDADFDFSYSVVKDQWQDLLDRPQVFNDQTWERLLFQLVSLLHSKRHEPHERKKDMRKEGRRKRVYVLLQELKPQINPFRGLLEDLGFDLSQSLDASENGPIIPSRLVHYPFPNYATVLEAPCLDDVNNLELTIEEVDRLFYEHQYEIKRKIAEWREQGEQQLVDLWTEEGRNALSITTGNATTTQLSNTDFLLRADTIFVCHTPGFPGTQLYPERYPKLVKERSFCHKYYELPSKMIYMKLYRHFEAEKVTKAILGRHEMPDAMYYELEVKGAAFVCERCEHKEPQTWDEMLEHYIYEGKIWHQQTQQDPIVKTSVPVTILYTHDPTVTLNPFIHILDDEDKDKPTVPPTLINSEPLDCLLCKNRHHRRTVENLEDMKRHLLNVHKISTVWGDVMYEPSTYGGHFDEGTSEWEKAWKCQWDSYSRMYL